VARSVLRTLDLAAVPSSHWPPTRMPASPMAGSTVAGSGAGAGSSLLQDCDGARAALRVAARSHRYHHRRTRARYRCHHVTPPPPTRTLTFTDS
jgi:hypothetical protein